MTKKTRLTILAAIAVAVAAVVVLLLLRRGAEADRTPPAPKPAVYDRSQNPEYQRIMEFEKAEQRRTQGEIARARQNLAEAKQAGLEPEVVKELEDAVSAAERQLELERERMRANLRRELWKEQHPEHVKVLQKNRADEIAIMAEIDAARERLGSAKAAGAAADETAALEAEIEGLVKKLAENHLAADKTLRELGK